MTDAEIADALYGNRGKTEQKDTGLGLIAGDDRLMAFLEDDIEAMEAEQEAEERRAEENWKKL